jgi:hypothetical protein
MSGRRVEFIPEADVWHDYSFSRNPQKYYYIERNRLLLVASVYEARTLALLTPALLVLEIGMVLLAARQGWFLQKLRGWHWLLRNARWVARHRRDVQAMRAVGDSGFVPLLVDRFNAGQVIMPNAARPIDWLLGRYWQLVSPLLLTHELKHVTSDRVVQ